MGGSVSAGRNNDELIDHLVEAEFIKTPLVQRVFRAVDRGNYYVPNRQQNAYKDIAWRMGNLHLSAPCVYSVVLETLKLKPGLSFLNIGSGTGYLSTVAGLILGTYGINHGIELYSEIVDFAYDRLEEFLKKSNAVDQYDFCEPTFMVGNCLTLEFPCQQYDRVYCGASCPAEYEHYMKYLIKVGGILIMPLNERLLKITRTSETTWHIVKVLSVSFAPLVIPPSRKDPLNRAKLNDTSPPKLMNICRSYIRSIFRDKINREHPNLELRLKKREKRPRRHVRRIVIPFYDEADLSESASNSEVEYESDSPEYTISSPLPSRMSIFLEDFLRRHAELQLLRDIHDQFCANDAPPPRASAQPHTSTQSKNPTTQESEDSSEEDNDGGSADKSSELISLITVSNVGQSSSSDDSSNFSKPPSQSTRSRKKRNLKRKHPASSKLPSTSSERSPEPKKKMKRTSATVVWKKLVGLRDGQEEAASQPGCSDDENYSDLMAQKIGALPLPSVLLRYLNYSRQNL